MDDDRFPFDLNGHGTHVAGTIAQSTNNGKGVAGIAYRAEIMPLRVLDADGAGDTVAISRAIRYAARRRVDVINLSLEFDSSVRASQIPDIVSRAALRAAARRGGHGRRRQPGRRRGGLPGAGGIGDRRRRHHRARLPGRLLQRRAATSTWWRPAAASTHRRRSPTGSATRTTTPSASPTQRGKDIFQQTFTRSVRRFGLPDGYEGTSMAAPTWPASPRS